MRIDAYLKRICIYYFWEAPLGGLHGERQQWRGQHVTYRERAAPATAGAGWGGGDLERQSLRTRTEQIPT